MTKAGLFRVLISGTPNEKHTKDGLVSEFAFCGLAKVDESKEGYQMCQATNIYDVPSYSIKDYAL
ncbi:hypothetical protein FRC09_009996, partial [Ceratobasidium sp. 395]